MNLQSTNFRGSLQETIRQSQHSNLLKRRMKNGTG